MALASGTLTALLEFQRRVESSDDAHGAPIPVYTTEFKRRAQIRPLSGTERIEAERTIGRVTHEIKIRYYPELTPEYRAFEDRSPTQSIFHIVSVTDPDRRRRDLVIMAKEDVVTSEVGLYDVALYDSVDTYG